MKYRITTAVALSSAILSGHVPALAQGSGGLVLEEIVVTAR